MSTEVTKINQRLFVGIIRMAIVTRVMDATMPMSVL